MDLENAMFMWGPMHLVAGLFGLLFLGELYSTVLLYPVGLRRMVASPMLILFKLIMLFLGTVQCLM